MEKQRVLERIQRAGLVAVVRSVSAEQGMKTVRALLAGGVEIIEAAVTTPGAVRLIESLAQQCGERAVVGAGTVLDPETARACMLAGAQFVVSPALNTDVIRMCNRYSTAVFPGVLSPAEVVTALEYGADVMKLFPGSSFSPSYLREMRGPFPNARFMPTGGIGLSNIGEWLSAGAFAVGVGGSLTAGEAGGDYAQVERAARAFVEKVHGQAR